MKHLFFAFFLFASLVTVGQKTAGSTKASPRKKITVAGKPVVGGATLSMRAAGISGNGDKTAALQTLAKSKVVGTLLFDEANRRYQLSGIYNGSGKVHRFANGARISGAVTVQNVVVDAPAGAQVFDTATNAVPLNDVWSTSWFGFSAGASAVVNSKALKNIEWAINQRGGNVVLEIDKGNYAVGTQVFAGQANVDFSYRSEDVFHVQGVKNLEIRGNGATIETAKGMRIGSFHPVTGRPVYPRAVTTKPYAVGNNVTVAVRPLSVRVRPGAVFNFKNGAQLQVNVAAPEGATSLTGNLYNKPLAANDSGAIWGYDDYNYRAAAPFVFKFTGCRNVRLQNLKFYGNIENTVLGGNWGSGYEVAGTGIRLVNTSDFVADGVESNNHVTDGLEVTNYAYTKNDSVKKVTLLNCRFSGNGRQGFSWTGGNHLYARNCEFSNTGQMVHSVAKLKVYSGPGGGIDIEPEADANGKLLLCLNGTFDSCRFSTLR